MEDSMLIYSEKMKRISRQRLGQVSQLPPVPSKEKKPTSTHVKDDGANVRISPDGKNLRSDRKSTSQLRSLSDASKYKSVREKNLSKLKKKTSLDMTGYDFGKHSHETLENKEHDKGKLIAGAWESVCERPQRRRGVTDVPKLETLSVKENSDVDNLPFVRTSPSNRLSPIVHSPLSDVSNENIGFGSLISENGLRRGENKITLVSDDSQEGLEDLSSFEDRADSCLSPSTISQMVLKSFSSEKNLERSPRSVKDTSSAELKLLSRVKQRTSSSSAPSSPAESSEDEDNEIFLSRRRTKSESTSVHSSCLKSVLKKQPSFSKKPTKGKKVSFQGSDTIRVISPCFLEEYDDYSCDASNQSQHTIVIISD